MATLVRGLGADDVTLWFRRRLAKARPSAIISARQPGITDVQVRPGSDF